MCALNHYCAITRVDYHEFRHCLESAASALASSSARPNVCIPIAANIALLLATYTIMKCQQRKLLFEWLQFLVVDLVIGMWLLVNGSRKLIVIMLDALLSSQWKNDCAENQVMPGKSSLHMFRAEYSDKTEQPANANGCIISATDYYNDGDDEPINFFSSTKMATYQMYHCHTARISRCMEYRSQDLAMESMPMHNNNNNNNNQNMMLPMTQIASASHQNTYQFTNTKCKSCQTKLFTNVDSLKQMPKPMDSVTEIHTSLPHNV